MNIGQLPQQIEIVFWNTAISMMMTSPHVQYIIRKAYPILKGPKRASLLFLTLAWAAIGLVLGFGLSLWVYFPR